MADINRTLDVLLKEYPAAFKMLRSAEYVPPNTMHGTFKVNAGWNYAADGAKPSEDSPVDHFALTEASFSTNQMAYVLVSHMAQEGALRNVRPIPLEKMNEKKFNRMVITDFDVSFREPFRSTNEFCGTFTVKRHRVMRTPSGLYVFTHHEFDFMDGKAYGTSKGATQLDVGELLDNTHL
jgi:hypothetical protein